ncbi:Uncharacterized conserved protein [Salmonella enterica subsp. enterica]|uniref:Uncharacterized conserved protein n=1 Tax=Salmonella enterica I TaxID=59201 RepID=A0A379UWU9_SALET|nr:Uncharacterized conserved protein [Salmonella enterica subsp. enterica]
MNMYLNYAKEHWTMPGENPPVGLVLCAGKGAGEAHYALTGLPNTIMASEYKVQLPDEKITHRRTYSFANHAGNSTHTRWFTDNGEKLTNH